MRLNLFMSNSDLFQRMNNIENMVRAEKRLIRKKDNLKFVKYLVVCVVLFSFSISISNCLNKKHIFYI